MRGDHCSPSKLNLTEFSHLDRRLLIFPSRLFHQTLESVRPIFENGILRIYGMILSWRLNQKISNLYLYCQDEDECAAKGYILCDQVCLNAIGSYSCDCNNGYRLIEDEKTCNGEIFLRFMVSLLKHDLRVLRYLSFFLSASVRA